MLNADGVVWLEKLGEGVFRTRITVDRSLSMPARSVRWPLWTRQNLRVPPSLRRRPRLFVFRTLTVDDRLAATLPGVRPPVKLLLELRTKGRIRRA